MGVNWGFADGHVEVHGPDTMKAYYAGNVWNWR